jgi:hypothetical protein
LEAQIDGFVFQRRQEAGKKHEQDAEGDAETDEKPAGGVAFKHGLTSSR